MKTYVKNIVTVALTCFLLGIITCAMVTNKNIDLVIAEAIIDHPEIFPLNPGLHTYCEKWLSIYNSMNEDNFNDQEPLGYTLAEAKTAALSKILKVMTDSMASYYKNSNTSTFGAFRIGDLKHTITGNYKDHIGWTKQQHATYLANLQKILIAIPNNLPSKEVLSRYSIVNIHYLDNFAQIEFKEDIMYKNLALNGKIYRKQF